MADKTMPQLIWSFVRQYLANALKSKKFIAWLSAMALVIVTQLAALLTEYAGFEIPKASIEHCADKLTDTVMYLATAYFASQSLADHAKKNTAEPSEAPV